MSLYKGLFGFSLLLSEQAFADVQQQATDLMGSGATTQIMLLAAFAFIFYFVIIRPQNKRAKDHQQLVTSLQKGDEVITSGGILGKISRVTDNFLIVSIAEGVEVPIQRQAIATSVPKGTLKAI
jgi:preprotein translocase subunit YajC